MEPSTSAPKDIRKSAADICVPSTSRQQNQQESAAEIREQSISTPQVLQEYAAEIREQSTSTPPDRRHEEQQESHAEQSKTVKSKMPVTPDIVRPYPTLVRNKKSNKGRKPGKSRIYTDTPEKKPT